MVQPLPSPTFSPTANRPAAGGAPFDRHGLWLRHLDLVATPTHYFERHEGPRLRRFPDWSRSPAAPRPSR